MFKTFEELIRFGESAGQAALKSVARWAAGSAIAAAWIQTVLYSCLVIE